MTSPLHFSKDPTDSFAVKKLFDENSLGPLYSQAICSGAIVDCGGNSGRRSARAWHYTTYEWESSSALASWHGKQGPFFGKASSSNIMRRRSSRERQEQRCEWSDDVEEQALYYTFTDRVKAFPSRLFIAAAKAFLVAV